MDQVRKTEIIDQRVARYAVDRARPTKHSQIMIRLLHIALLSASALLANNSTRAEPPVKVYILVGQSNMQGKGAIEGEGTNTLRQTVQDDPGKKCQFLVKDDGE